MYNFTSPLIKVDVTSVKICKPYVLCGIGSQLHIYKLYDSKPLHKINVFSGLRIYGIQINDSLNRLLCHGENELKLFTSKLDKLHFDEIRSVASDDWILDAKWIGNGDKFATVSMHSVVRFWNDRLVEIKQAECEENCILYCAKLSFGETGELICFSGTVFSEILIWRPVKGKCKVLHRLIGHDGVLFSIDHDPQTKHVSSTSDDRSLILWIYENDIPKKLFRKFGHSARVFRTKLLPNSVISAGEDGVINIYTLTGDLVKKIDAHQGGTVWSIDSTENIIVTGGADAGVTIFPIDSPVKSRKLAGLSAQPKKLGLLKGNVVVAVMDDGGVHLSDAVEYEWRLVALHEELRSYVLLEISECRRKVVFAGFHGHLFIYHLNNTGNELVLTVARQTLRKKRIYSAHWLSCDDILTCEPDGLLYLWHLSGDTLLPLHVMQLPNSKERWSTTACLAKSRIIVGDRRGNMHLFSLQEIRALCTVKRAHNHLGVSKVYFDGGEGLVSLGRNSAVRKYRLDGTSKTLQTTSTDKLPFTWLTMLHKNQQTTLLVAFSGSSVILWDYSARRILLEIKCGGGHRSYDFNQNDDELTFTYIKGKTIERLDLSWSSIYAFDLIEGINTDEINDLCCFESALGCVLLSGGEDTTLRLSLFTESSVFKQTLVLKSHLSSIRCLYLHNGVDGRYILFSAGGRAQIIMWEIARVSCTELFSYYEEISDDDSEIRVMDLTVTEINGVLTLLAACSDGKVKFYEVMEGAIKYLRFLQYDLRCILKLGVVGDVLITMATDGFIVFWNFTSEQPFYRQKTHKSGINSYSITQYGEGSYGILTGGDDNTIVLTKIKLGASFSSEKCYVNSVIHSAQVTGVCLMSGVFMTVGLDKKLCVFNYDEAMKVAYKGACNVSISDVKGLKVVSGGDERLRVVVYGLGVQIVDVNKVTCNLIKDVPHRVAGEEFPPPL